jgi:hypothetical protein
VSSDLKIKVIPSFFGLLCLILAWVVPVCANNNQFLSSNILLDSYIYSYLDKLDGLGYLDTMQTGAKPYTRMQVARWLKTMQAKAETSESPVYARLMLNELAEEFRVELALLDGEDGINQFRITQINWTNTYYDGSSLTQQGNQSESAFDKKGTNSFYQPLNINNNGHRFAEDLNSVLTLRMEGNLGNFVVFSATPRFSHDKAEDLEADLDSAYFKTHFKNLQIQLGKDPMWWGPGERGNLALTNNSEPFTAFKLSNLEPMNLPGWFKYLGPTDINFFYSKLEEDRSDDIDNLAFMGLRTDFTPGSNFTFGAGLNSFLGGKGHEFGWDDLWDFITQKNAESASEEKWNTIAGFDFRWRLPRLNGLQLYGELYGEDQAGSFPPLPSRNGFLFGFYLPRLTADGAWDLQLETARTNRYYYVHYLYKDGYVNDGNIIGDAMGHNARRYYAQLNHYLNDGTRLGLHAEYLSMEEELPNPQTVNSVWVSYSAKLKDSWTLNATAGLADIDHLDYQADQSDRNYLLSIGLSKRF